MTQQEQTALHKEIEQCLRKYVVHEEPYLLKSWSVTGVDQLEALLSRSIAEAEAKARIDENEIWFQKCKGVMSHAVYAARFRDRQGELKHLTTKGGRG